MRSFADLDRLIAQVPGPVVTALGTVDVGRGSEALYRDQLPGLLRQLADRARVASITASSAIEGVVVPDNARADRILAGKVTQLRTRSEQELAGYRDAQDYLFQGSWRPLNSGLLLHLHKMLFAHTAAPGGRFKTEDNLVVDRSSSGEVTVGFRPVRASDTPFYVSELIDRYLREMSVQRHHPVLLVGLFALDLLVIHPFEDGNGRVTRALTNALLMDAGYTVSRYVSLEQLIAETADTYYQALLDSTHGWHEDRADPWPWLSYFVNVLATAYRTFAQRAASDRSDGSKQDRVREYVLNHAPAVFRMADVRTALPGVSDPTIRVVLDRLRREGVIHPEGLGRSAAWRRSSR
ncbi:Fic family protein [Micromonospora globispora]|uniref:Fic family protein n=1 Tax=Micromonospora globispora TaxID=1450148 RepID=UPI000D7037D6|nr:Fic family protein [Micromonospora globispora]PWU60006.1 Fic family protein [Micromonospora globispora]RQW97011.1 Fic family protein [Micromonospora globispora]